ncbi:HlyC/CorC family transporter [Candidatus Micrarchaeota archaeon]|nr:HlyC/CorC family transporter [Candidatus Micrarchaeota archaeon]
MLVSLVLLIILIIFSAVFSSSESALLSLTLARAKTIAEIKNNRILEKLKTKQDEIIIAILLGNNLVNIGATALATQIALAFSSNYGVAIVTGVMTFIILTFGEIFPKIIATKYKEKYLLLIGGPLYFWYLLVFPVVYVYNAFITILRNAFGVKRSPTITEGELEEMIRIGVSEGEIDEEEKEYLLGVLELTGKTAEDVMIPRDKIFAVEDDITVNDLITIMRKKKQSHSRIPVYHEKFDNIKGIVNIRDLINILHHKNWKTEKVKNIMHKPLFVSEYTPLDDIIEKMRAEKQLLTIVLDDRATVVGLVSLEDILEEIVGEVYDEFDRIERKVWKTSNGYIIRGDLNSDDLYDKTEIKLPDDVSTVSEFVVMNIKDIPEVGDTFEYDGYTFEVKKVKKNKVVTIKVEKKK